MTKLESLNIHPRWRKLELSHIRQVRMLMRTGRYQADCRRIIKEAQRSLLATRRRIAPA